MVSTFGRTQAAAIQKGFKDSIETYILISGMIFLKIVLVGHLFSSNSFYVPTVKLRVLTRFTNSKKSYCKVADSNTCWLFRTAYEGDFGSLLMYCHLLTKS